MKDLISIQAELKAPKSQYNSFAKYKYRNLEDILEAVKPLLVKYKCSLVISDSVKETCGILYTEALAKFTDSKGDTVECTAQAGIDVHKKGMDVAQSFGASSSYARKYCMNALFLIDDTKDADATNDHKDKDPVKEKLTSDRFAKAKVAVEQGKWTANQLIEKYDLSATQKKELQSI
jgi:hypothetical protein